MKNLVVFGANNLGRLLKYYVEKCDDRKIVAFTMDANFIEADLFLGLPVIPFEELESLFPPSENEILLAIGEHKMNDIRKDVFYRCKQKGYRIASFFHPSCSINSDDVGEGNIFLENCLVYPFARIGNGNLCWDHVLISHDCVVGDFNTFSSYADLCGYVNISNNGFFGKHCVIQEHSIIADYTLVGATAFVKKGTEKYDVVVPAKSVILTNKKSTDFF